ncbi:hypothetical protein PF005_g15506 [Phytophthora fragariae]|uniref:Uncharacterized protein n=1 Tax=Phytophthora fragariae TaxID=53985 RepID=A0A6A4D7D8_9STRA|nr:hypothetical protein PF003_g2575 [Phytophthora fragariae]KAE9102298.1 hypothetical protein PF007_g14810 [Phytophthora fragariae]KAE9135624.1 hypothetical protein PF006_g14560 [Phytophthora fragariae]KAE9200027.1 hypothetical protein PF005_g15506 [Phytophthora fragariae]KAE9216456.1 hypothetical protein PF002_g17077 [Phytophthora fragariae]
MLDLGTSPPPSPPPTPLPIPHHPIPQRQPPRPQQDPTSLPDSPAEATDAESEADVEDPQQGDEMPLEEGYYVYTRVVGTERTADGELRAWVEWESTLEPLSALYPDDARALAIYLGRPQTMPTEPPPYHYDGIRGMVYTDERDLRVWMNWPNTLEPISSLTAADERKLSVPTNKSLHPTP